MDSDVQKVIELICSALPPQDFEGYDDFHEINLTEEDFKRQGLTLDGGITILKHRIAGEEPIIGISGPHTGSVEGYDSPELDGVNFVSFHVHPAICSSLSSSPREQKPRFSFGDCTLTVNGIEISFGSIDNKENGCYVLEHLFSHDLKEVSDYKDIHDQFFGGEKYNWKRYYDACQVIQKKIVGGTGIVNFLLFNSSTRGFVKINPKYLP